jgi:general secretion pathway protein J
LEFTRSGWRNLTEQGRSDLQRVAYEFTENQLIRYYWQVLDRGISVQPQAQVLMGGIDNISFRFRDNRALKTTPTRQSITSHYLRLP